jgi:hypothetical protein
VGIVLALALSSLVGLHVWSVCLIVGLGFLAGRVLRLSGGTAAQIPITGLFLLALGTGLGPERVVETLIGVAVAVVVNLVVVPPNHVSSAARAVGELAEAVVDVLSEMAAGIARPWRAEDAARWLRRAREQDRLTDDAEAAVDQAGESLRLRPGRIGWTGTLLGVRQAISTLAVVDVQVRVLARTLRDTAGRLPVVDGRQLPLPMAADMLGATAAAIEAFAAALVRSEPAAAPDRIVEPDRREAVGRALAQARDRIAAINADLADMMAASLERGLHLGTLVVETSRILDELGGGLAVVTNPRPPRDTRREPAEPAE